MYRKLRILYLVALMLVIPLTASAQPTVSLSVDKSSYEMFEPIIIDFAITNNTSERQNWGPASIAGRSGIGWGLSGPSGMVGSPIFDSHPSPYKLAVTYEPGQSRSGQGYGLLNWTPYVTGSYTLEVSVGDPTNPTIVAQASFDIVSPTGVDSTLQNLLVDLIRDKVLFREAFSGYHGPPEHFEAQLDSIADLPGLPAHIEEFTRFVHALFADIAYQEYGQRDSTDASERFAAFVTDYPNSVYKRAAEQGLDGIARLGGEEDFYSQLDSVSTLLYNVFLEGAHSGNGMSTTLNQGGNVPKSESFDVEPWNHISYPFRSYYSLGHRTVDWTLVVLVDSTGTVVDRMASVLADNGQGVADFVNLPPGNYRVIVEHRNHLPVASSTLVDFTSGFATYDFTTGNAYTDTEDAEPQKEIISGQDTVYAMFTGDNSADGHITATDFNKWLAQTKAAATGYIESDHNLDGQSTASDFNLWLTNTKAAERIRFPIEWIYPDDGLAEFWNGEGSLAAPKTSITEDDIRVRYRLTGSSSNGFVNTYIDFKQDTGGSELDTLGSATFDVYYNSDQVAFDFASHYVDLLEAGYTVEINEGVNAHGSFMRADIYTWKPDTVSYDIRPDWENVLRFNFDATGAQITEHGVGMNLSTMKVFLVSDAVYREASAIVPWWADGGFSY